MTQEEQAIDAVISDLLTHWNAAVQYADPRRKAEPLLKCWEELLLAVDLVHQAAMAAQKEGDGSGDQDGD